MENKSYALISGVVIAVILVGAAFYSSDGNDNDRKQTGELAVVRAATPEQGTSVIFIIADKKGFFEREGIKIEYVGVIGSQQGMPALGSGSIDVSAGGHPDATINAIRAGVKIKQIAAGSDSTKANPHHSYFVLENSTIRTANDLIGKKIQGLYGAGEHIEIRGCTGMAYAEYLKNNGINIRDAKIEGVELPAAQVEQALKQGLIDVGGFNQPKSGKILKTPGYRLLFDDYDALAPTYGTGALSVIKANTDFIKEHPETVKGFVTAIAKAMDWSNANPEESNQIIAKELGLTPEQIKYMDRRVWVEHGLESDKNIQMWIDLMVKYGELKEGQVKPSDVYTNEFNPYYKK